MKKYNVKKNVQNVGQILSTVEIFRKWSIELAIFTVNSCFNEILHFTVIYHSYFLD